MTFFKRTVTEAPVHGKTVLVRVDYNVPLSKTGQVRDDLRIRASLSTIQYLRDQGCKVVLIAHLGRPDGRQATLSLEPIAARLAELLDAPVTFVDDCIGEKVRQAVRKASSRAVILLENLRFYTEEEANNEEFAKKIAHYSEARYFVQDGFGVVHRAHASTDALTHYLPSVAGLLLQREYQTITASLQNPKRPLVAVVGGAKISDKIGVIERFIDIADSIVIGGAMANTFLAYKGQNVGSSIVETGQEPVLDAIYEKARQKHGADVDKFLILPSDVAVASRLDASEQRRSILVSDIAPTDIALDIGDASIERMVNEVSEAGTVLWNGTLGYAEFPEFAHGSARLALALATNPGIASIVGGGDTADFVLKWDGNDGASFTHVSTGGGAALELMAGKALPGIESLLDGPR